jgi:hypothetical protein
MNNRSVFKLFLSISIYLFLPAYIFCAEPDTLKVFESTAFQTGSSPEGWKVKPSKNRLVLTSYSVERSIDGPYMRIVSNNSNSALEIDLGEIDPNKYSKLTWRWKVDKFPTSGWEEKKENCDFAVRLEVVCDFKGSYINPLNILKKGFLTSVFLKYPPEIILSYVWSLNTPAGEPFTSPETRKTTIIPVQSNNITGTWMSETRNIAKDLTMLKMAGLIVKKIRVRADTDNSGSSAESGLKYIYFVK